MTTSRTANRERPWFVLGVAVLLLLGAFLRIYRLEAQPLWLDELYTAQLMQAGWGTIWETAFVDITPPPPHAPFWLAVQLGGATALSLRLVSVIAALIALLAFYGYCRLAMSKTATLIATGLLAIAPLAIYYAQEARPYALGLMSITLTLVAYELVRRRGSALHWALYAVLATLAGHVYYLNVVLVGGQLVALLILARDRKRVLVGGAATVLLTALTLGPFFVGAGTIMGGWKDVGVYLGFTSTIKTMLAGDARFAPALARTAAMVVVTAGFALALINHRTWPALLPHALQIAFAILISFVLLPLLGRPAPAYDERAFLMLLPSALAGFSLGVETLLTHRPGRWVAAGLVLVVVLTSFASLWHYFGDFNKSPEGELARIIADRAEPDDLVVAHGDAYSVDAAVRLYRPELAVYRYHAQEGERWIFVPDPKILRKYQYDTVEMDELLGAERIWLVLRAAEPPYLDFLLSQYRVQEEYSAAPFRVLALERR